MRKIIRLLFFIGLIVSLCSCRESIPGKYSHEGQFGSSMELTVTASILSLVETNTALTEIASEETTPEVQETPEVHVPSTEENGIETETDIHWSYSGETGPENWGSINEEYALCGTGKSQSPVDIQGVTGASLPDITFYYHSSPLSVTNNGHTIQVNIPEGSYFEIDGTKYYLKQIHFHGPSEHTINGSYFMMEMHLVHQDDSGNYAVIGVMINEGVANETIQNIFDNMPETIDEEINPESVSIDPNKLLPEDKSYYHLMGSLTTPPCTEGVKWYILKNPIELSVIQIADYESQYINNNRPIQALNDRVIYEQTK